MIKRFIKCFEKAWIDSKKKNKSKNIRQIPNQNQSKTEQQHKPQSGLDKQNQQIKKAVKDKIFNQKAYSITQLIQHIKDLRFHITNQPSINRTGIMKCYYDALYSCQNKEYLPDALGGALSDSIDDFSCSGLYTPILHPKNKHEKDLNTEHEQLMKGAKDISAKNLVKRLDTTIRLLHENITDAIESHLISRVMVTSEDAKSCGLKPDSFTPITRLSSNYDSLDGSTRKDTTNKLKIFAIEDGGNALINVKVHHDRDDSYDVAGPSGTISADVINIKNKKLFKGDYGSDWKNSITLLRKLQQEDQD